MTRHEPPAAALNGATTRAFDQAGGRIEGKGINKTTQDKRTEPLPEVRKEAFELLGAVAHYCAIAQLNLEIEDDAGALYAARQARDYFTAAIRQFAPLRKGLAERIVAEVHG